jgi:hypothetical protein
MKQTQRAPVTRGWRKARQQREMMRKMQMRMVCALDQQEASDAGTMSMMRPLACERAHRVWVDVKGAL